MYLGMIFFGYLGKFIWTDFWTSEFYFGAISSVMHAVDSDRVSIQKAAEGDLAT